MQTNAYFIIYQQKLFPLFEHIKSSIVFYSIASTLSSLLLKTCSTTQNTIFKLTLLHISRKNSIFAAVLKVSDFVWCFQRLVFTYKTGVYTL